MSDLRPRRRTRRKLGALLRRRGVSHVVLLGLTGAVTADVIASGLLRYLDHLAYDMAATHIQGAWRWPFALMTYFGQRGVLLVPISALTIAGAWRHRSWRIPLAVALVVAGLAALQTAVKTPLGRTYPAAGHDNLFAGGSAYPSGHTLNAFVLGGLTLELLAVTVPVAARWLTPARLRGFTALAALVTGVGLVARNEHWLTDVLASWACGPILLELMVGWVPGGSAEPLTAASRWRRRLGEVVASTVERRPRGLPTALLGVRGDRVDPPGGSR